MPVPNWNDCRALFGHPVEGAIREGFVVENQLAVAPDRAHASFYRTAAGAEIDLLLELPGNGLWAQKIKRLLLPSVKRGSIMHGKI